MRFEVLFLLMSSIGSNYEACLLSVSLLFFCRRLDIEGTTASVSKMRNWRNCANTANFVIVARGLKCHYVLLFPFISFYTLYNSR